MVRKYTKRRAGGRRRRLVSTALVTRRRSGALVAASRAARVHPAVTAAMHAYDAAQYATNVYNRVSRGIEGAKGVVKPLKQTKAVSRGSYNQTKGKHRHEKLKQTGTVAPMNRGSGYNNRPNGVITTHGKGKVPKWKSKRLGLYKYDVWQTILISKSNRLAASNNVLETYRYPIKAPECLDSERVQCMMFQPFCSHYSSGGGAHTGMFRKIRADGTDIDHDTTQRLDIVQNKADIAQQLEEQQILIKYIDITIN